MLLLVAGAYAIVVAGAEQREADKELQISKSFHMTCFILFLFLFPNSIQHARLGSVDPGRESDRAAPQGLWQVERTTRSPFAPGAQRRRFAAKLGPAANPRRKPGSAVCRRVQALDTLALHLVGAAEGRSAAEPQRAHRMGMIVVRAHRGRDCAPEAEDRRWLLVESWWAKSAGRKPRMSLGTVGHRHGAFAARCDGLLSQLAAAQPQVVCTR